MPAHSAGALGCRTHTGWAVLVVIAGGPEQPEVVARTRAELSDSSGRVQKNVYQASRALKPADAAARIAAAERIAARQAAAELERTVRATRDRGIVVRRCAVVTGAFPHEARLESILASHALCHAAEGRLYQRALLEGAEARGLVALAVPKRAIWDEAESTLGFTEDDLRRRIDDLRSRIGPPWAEDQKLAALAAWIVLAEPGGEV